MMNKVGMLIQRAIDRQNMTQREVAELAGIAHSTINRIINGQVYPNMSTLIAIGRVIGVNPVELALASTEDIADAELNE